VSHPTPSPRHRQVGPLGHRFADAPGLPFADLLPDDQVEQALRDEYVPFRRRLYSPLVTLWVFLSQVLDPDHSCGAAVSRFLAWRAARGLAPCSNDTGAYCKARSRLPEAVLARLARQAGQRPQDEAPKGWRWDGRTVKVVDGTTVSMPDTPANQREYPQSRSQKPGVGFPVARLVVPFSLAVGTALDCALGSCRGKRTGETSLFATLGHDLEGGDILLADRYYGSYWEMAMTQQCKADMVCRLHQKRESDFRRGRRPGRGDHVVVWVKPRRPGWMDEAAYDALPDTLPVRETRVHVEYPGFRTRVLVGATTLLDAERYPPSDVGLLYRVRWYAGVDLRALKQTPEMDVLRGQTPEMVRKEVWTHLLGYNLLRGLMAEVAKAAGVLPWELSFKGAMQAVNAFAGVLWTAGAEQLEEGCRRPRAAIARHRVGDRPNRYEPRRRKRRPKPYPLLNEPRSQARSRLEAATCG
jgi:Transposase DDE domain